MKRILFFFFTVYAFGALATTQTIPYLKQNGFSEMNQGWILSSIALFTIGLQIITGIISDKTGKIKCLFLIVFGSCTVLSIIMYLNTLNQFWLCFLVVGWIGGAARCFQSMIDTWSLEMSSKKKSFEKFKAIGSVGWAAGSWMAALIVLNSFSLLGWICALFAIITLWNMLKIKDTNRSSEMEISQLKELIQNKEYVLLNLIMFVLFAMGCADIYLVVDKIIEVGGNSFHIGLKWGIQSLAEAPVFFLSDRLIQKFQRIPLLIFSTIMFGIRFLMYSFLNHHWAIVFAALMQSVTFPIASYCVKTGIDECTDEHLKSSSQLAGASFYMGVSLLIMPVLTNWLSELFSIDIALLITASFSFIALILILAYKKISS